MAVGHVRYGTTGASNRNNCQPIEVNHQKGRMAWLTTATSATQESCGMNWNFREPSFTLQRYGDHSLYHNKRETQDIVHRGGGEIGCKISGGAYSLVLMSPRKLICVRDPHGFRPLCYGKTEDGAYVIASESCGLSAVGARFIRDVEPES